MAQNFRRYIARNTGTGPATIFTADSFDTVIGIRCANVHATSSVSVSVYINDGSADYYLIKTAPIPVGSSIELIDGGAKVVVDTGDILKVASDTASSIDTWVSVVDAIST
tara:strand:- start:44 stop:373 length:330 start_codon:yes stop_codon:yes gene_type:complete